MTSKEKKVIAAVENLMELIVMDTAFQATTPEIETRLSHLRSATYQFYSAYYSAHVAAKPPGKIKGRKVA